MRAGGIGFLILLAVPLLLNAERAMDFYLRCDETDENKQTCHGGYVGTFDKSNNFTRTVVTSDSIRAGRNSAFVNENGVQITTGQGTFSGEYFNNEASVVRDGSGNVLQDRNPITLAGNGRFQDWTFNVNSSDLSHYALAAGEAFYAGDPSATMAYLTVELAQGAWAFPGERIAEWLGAHPTHANALNYRFSSGPFPEVVNYGPSLHFVLPVDPRLTVPQPAGAVPFHVDAFTGLSHAVNH